MNIKKEITIPKLTLKEKLLEVICRMEEKRSQVLKIEDVYVRAYKAYPDDFHLRGYPEYPDTEIMSKRIYDLRKAGLIQITKKFIKLLDKGRQQGGRNKSALLQKNSISPQKTISRDVDNEIKRIKQTEAYKLFMSGRQSEMVDSDLYAFLGAAVKTERNTFLARLRTVQDAIQAYQTAHQNNDIARLSEYLLSKFKEIIDTKLQAGYPRR